jgi:hypothetical protein
MKPALLEFYGASLKKTKEAKRRSERMTANSHKKTGPDSTANDVKHSPTQVPELTDAERRFLDQYLLSRSALLPCSAPTFIAESSDDGPPHIKPDPQVDKRLWRAQIAGATGSTVEHAQEQIMLQLFGILRKASVAPAIELTNVLSEVLELAPKDSVEGRLAAQMVSTHKVAMDLLAKGIRGEQSIELADFYLRHSERLMRLFSLQVESLNRYRGRAPIQQKMTVEHVHVHEGAQAIVGNVTAPGKGATGEGGE